MPFEFGPELERTSDVKVIEEPKHRPRKLKRTGPNIHRDQEIGNALRHCGGFQTQAAMLLGKSQSAISKRIKESPYLQQIVNEAREAMIDAAEDKLYQKIREGNLTAIIFFLKCCAKERGYVERQEMQFEGNINSNVRTGVLLVPAQMEAEAWSEWVKKEQAKLMSGEDID